MRASTPLRIHAHRYAGDMETSPLLRFHCPDQWIDRRLNVALVGAGGTGGEVFDSLTRLDAGIRALGHSGLTVTVYDADIVEPHNIGRQRFSAADVGQYKALTLTHRANLFYGLDWKAVPRFFKPGKDTAGFDLVITCTDKARFRAQLGQRAAKKRDNSRGSSTPRLWLDFGNGAKQGQCVLGHLDSTPATPFWLPNVFDLYPNLSDRTLDEDSAPRCSLADALAHQDLFVNTCLARMGMNLIWQLLTNGWIDRHGVRVDVGSLSATPMLVDRAAWAFFGWSV